MTTLTTASFANGFTQTGGTLNVGERSNSAAVKGFARSIAGVFALGTGSKSRPQPARRSRRLFLMTAGGTLVTLAGNIAYAHAFTLTSGATLDLAGITLTLSAGDIFAGALLDGSGSLGFEWPGKAKSILKRRRSV